MAATVELLSYHGYNAGSPSSSTDVAGGNVRFKMADNDTLDTANPITIPAAGTNYSFIKQFKLSVQAWNSGTTTINNAKVSSGANAIGTGVDIGYKFSATYLDPTASGSAMATRAGSIIGTSGTPVTISGAGTISNPTTGTFTDYTVLQVEVSSTATQGTTPSQSITFQFDEF